MSERPTAAGASQRVGSGTRRLVRAWKVLPHESRLAGFASIALFLTLFLPWYQVTLIAPAKTAKLQSASASITGWGAFSFVEAAVLVVAAGVLVLLFQRAEGRAFHLPGGDGGVITAAGVWTCVLIVWRIFDKQGATTNGPAATTSGIEWGIFVALAAAAFLAYSGSRIRAAHRPEPPLPGEDRAPAGSSAAATVPGTPRPRRREERRPRPVEERMPAEARTSPEEHRPPETRRAPEGRKPPPPRRRPHPPVAEPPPVAQPQPQPVGEAAPARPRRRASAAELFERVVPDDPPAVPFGRVKPADVDETLRMNSTPRPDRSEPKTPPDEQLTMRLNNDDETLRLDRD